MSYARTSQRVQGDADALNAANPTGPWLLIHNLHDVAVQLAGIVTGDEAQIEATCHPNVMQRGFTVPAGWIDTLTFPDDSDTLTANDIVLVDAGPVAIRVNLSATAGGGDVEGVVTGTID